MSLGELVLRTAVGFVTLFLITRILGKKQMSQLTYFNYITGITFGSITASLLLTPNANLWYGIGCLLLWGMFTYLSGLLSLHSKRGRAVVDGQPTIVIKEGQVLERALGKLRMNIDDLLKLLRQQQIFTLAEVDYAIVETDGKVSVLKKVPFRSVAKQDVGAPFGASGQLPTKVIVDGKIEAGNLRKLQLSERWLMHELKMQGVSDPAQVFFAEVQADGTLLVDRYDDRVH